MNSELCMLYCLTVSYRCTYCVTVTGSVSWSDERMNLSEYVVNSFASYTRLIVVHSQASLSKLVTTNRKYINKTSKYSALNCRPVWLRRFLPPANAESLCFQSHLFVCLSVCLSVLCNAVTVDSLDLERKFIFVRRYVFRIFRSSLYIKVIGSKSRSREQKGVSACLVRGWSAFQWKVFL